MPLSGYSKIYQLGHPDIRDLFNDPVLIEEKVDGSQFSFGFVEGELQFKSKNKMVYPEDAGMFKQAVEAITDLHKSSNCLVPEYVYRGEYLQKEKHNCLEYGRLPRFHVIIFDVMTGIETYMPYDQKVEHCKSIGFDYVPRFTVDEVHDLDAFMALLDNESCLGKAKIEGVVIKNYTRFNRAGKPMMGKYVSEEYKENQKIAWKSGDNPAGSNQTKQDIIELLGHRYRTEARWRKGVQRARDDGWLEHSPRDIGGLLKSIKRDVKGECESEIKDYLFKHFWPQIERKLTVGFPEFYKQMLLEDQFNGDS